MSELKAGKQVLVTERLGLSLRVTSLMVLPPYKGGVFRGAFGSTFRRLVCGLRNQDCTTCILRGNCLYLSIFSPTPPSDFPDSAKFNYAPAPYILNSPLTRKQGFRPGEILEFELVLIGRAVDALPYFVYTFMEMGKRGIGRERGKYELLSVELMRNGEQTQIYDGRTQTLTSFPPGQSAFSTPEHETCNRVTLEFLTPLRLKVKGDLVTRLTFPVFFERLAERLSLLTALYGNNGTGPDLASLMALAQKIKVDEYNLRWYDWERYSARQQSPMKLGGLRRTITFTGDLSPFVPYLRLGEQVNVGQGTSFGLGRMRLDSHKYTKNTECGG
jgi:hypothetical protein